MSRQEFGHWELDLVLGGKTKDEPVINTLLERKTREYLTCKVWSKSADVITKYVWEKLKPYVEKEAVKTLTTDNGAEFSNLSSLEDQGQLKVYFAHAYASWEKGSNERLNGLLREFIPKGRSLKGLKYQVLKAMTNALNQRPRKILNYYSPDQLFEQEMNRLSRIA